MSWSGSAPFVHVNDGLAGTRNINLTGDSLKVALYNTTPTPDRTVSAANSCYNVAQWASANELTSSTDWPAGGRPGASVSFTASGAVYTFDMADTASATSGATITAAFGALVYSDTATTPADQGICYNYFGGSAGVTGGLFTIVWNGSGLWTATVS